MLEGLGEGGEGEDNLGLEIVGKVFCTNVIFQHLFKVDKLLIFRILPIKCIVTYFTDIMICFTPMPRLNFHFLGKSNLAKFQVFRR